MSKMRRCLHLREEHGIDCGCAGMLAAVIMGSNERTQVDAGGIERPELNQTGDGEH